MRDRLRGGRLLIGGHRGNPSQFPENTLASFASALDLGVDVIECDVHLTADRRLAVIHDHTLERTTNGGGPVGLRTMAELKTLDAGKGETIPTLEEVLDATRGRAGLAIEIKSLPVIYPGLEEILVDCLRQAAMVDQVVVISFDHRVVARVKDLEPAIVVGVLLAGRPLLIPQLLEYTGADVYSPHWSFADQETVAEVHECGAVVGVWTVDDVATLQLCQMAGVDAVYSNRPGELVAALAGPT